MRSTDRERVGNPPAARPRRDRIDGVLLLDKPRGPSSNDALQQARRLLGAAKAGHGGTLDPMASGLLPVAFGEATKFLHDLLDAEKRYEATVRLGVSTDTFDAEGVETGRAPVEADDAAIRAVCEAFAGEIEQVPPMHSALKRDGRPLYEYARAGIEFELAPRRLTVYALTVEAIERAASPDPSTVSVRLSLRVSKGFYVRSLARDIGERLGCGAHLEALRRTGVAGLEVGGAVTLDRLEAMTLEDRRAALAPVDALLTGMPKVELDDELARRFLHGQRLVLQTRLPDVPRVRVYRASELLGVAQCVPPGLLAPLRLVVQPTHD